MHAMRRRSPRLFWAALVSLVLALGGGAALAVNASASGPVLSTTERGLCIKSGTGEPRSLWLVAATHKCPEPYWGPASLKDAFGIEGTGTPGPVGPAGPKGDKGDPGTNNIVFGHAEQKVTQNTTFTLMITGQPKFSALVGKRTLVVTGPQEVSGSINLDIQPTAPAVGDTDRKFVVTVTGMSGDDPDFTVTVDTLIVAEPAAS